MLKTFLSELTTQSKTALSFGTRLIVLRGRSTRSTLSDLIVFKFLPAPSLSLLFKTDLKGFNYIIWGRIIYLKAKATRAQMTTVASSMFQMSLKYEPGCKINPKSIIYVIIYDELERVLGGDTNDGYLE